MTRLALLLALLCAPAGAATLSDWTDPEPAVWTPGGNPCRDTCTREWALGELVGAMPAKALAEFAAMHRGGAPMREHWIPRGALILAMAEGGPRMLHRPMTSGIETWAPGWRVGSYLLVRFRECGNWALLWMEGEEENVKSSMGWFIFNYRHWFSISGDILRNDGRFPFSNYVALGGTAVFSYPLPTPPITPTPAPLPSSALMLIVAMGVLFGGRQDD